MIRISHTSTSIEVQYECMSKVSSAVSSRVPFTGPVYSPARRVRSTGTPRGLRDGSGDGSGDVCSTRLAEGKEVIGGRPRIAAFAAFAALGTIEGVKQLVE